jgi:hypothetical protein
MALPLLVGLSLVIIMSGTVGPLLGTLAALLAGNSLAQRLEVATLYRFESDRHEPLRRSPR